MTRILTLLLALCFASSLTMAATTLADWSFAKDSKGQAVSGGQTITDSSLFDASGNKCNGHLIGTPKYATYSPAGKGLDGYALDVSSGGIQFYDVPAFKKTADISIWCRIKVDPAQTTECNVFEKNMPNGYMLKLLYRGTPAVCRLDCSVAGIKSAAGNNWLLDGNGPQIINDGKTWTDLGLSLQKLPNGMTRVRIYQNGKLVKSLDGTAAINTDGWFLVAPWKNAQILYDRVTFYDGVLDDTEFANLSQSPTQPVASTTQTTILTNYRKDFTAQTPGNGWQYLWNATGEIGHAENYQPLQWNAPRQFYSIDAQSYPLAGSYLCESRLGGHPGKGSQVAADKIDRYTIAAYTIPAGISGHGWITDGAILRALAAGEPTPGGTLDLRVYVQNSEKTHLLIKTQDMPTTFTADLGQVKEGDVVYLAVGPDKIDSYDGYQLDYTISLLPEGTVPAPPRNTVKEDPTKPALRYDNNGNPVADWLHAHEQYVARGRQGETGVLFIGDSITHGWNWNGKDVWGKRLATYHPANFGFSGDLTQHVLWRIANGELDNIHPKLVVLLIGTNNIGIYSAQEIADGVTAVIQQIRAKLPSTPLLVMGIWPRGENPADAATAAIRKKLSDANGVIAKLADGKMIRYLYIGDKFLQPDGRIPKDLMPDFLHPNSQGYDIWADALAPYLHETMPDAKP
ncbi:MAG TPA: GDSL-type esterase/lipase family protein [Armatimonadota bacterium]|nr:GDSL-type esterase/lipase family protein [Armatimonadota bacterium]